MKRVLCFVVCLCSLTAPTGWSGASFINGSILLRDPIGGGTGWLFTIRHGAYYAGFGELEANIRNEGTTERVSFGIPARSRCGLPGTPSARLRWKAISPKCPEEPWSSMSKVREPRSARGEGNREPVGDPAGRLARIPSRAGDRIPILRAEKIVGKFTRIRTSLPGRFEVEFEKVGGLGVLVVVEKSSPKPPPVPLPLFPRGIRGDRISPLSPRLDERSPRRATLAHSPGFPAPARTSSDERREVDCVTGALSCGVARVSRGRSRRPGTRVSCDCNAHKRTSGLWGGSIIFGEQGLIGGKGWPVTIPAGALFAGFGELEANVLSDGRTEPGFVRFAELQNWEWDSRHPVGTLTVTGDFRQRAGGILVIDVKSRARHDLLRVSGTATLSGMLRIQSLGYRPREGDRIKCIDARRIVGDFSEVRLAFPCPYEVEFRNVGGKGFLVFGARSRRRGTLRGFPGGRFGGFNDSSDSRGRHSETAIRVCPRILNRETAQETDSTDRPSERSTPPRWRRLTLRTASPR